MDLYFGPAVLLLDGEEFSVMAYIDSNPSRGIEDWGGFLETGTYGDVIQFRASDPEEIGLQVPGRPPVEIGVAFLDEGGFAFTGMGASPLPVPAG